MDKEIISRYLYDQYTKEFTGVKEWGKPDYKKWLEEKLFEAQTKSQKSAIPNVSLCDFRAALTLLRDLADIQNGAPLVTVEKEWKEIMNSTYDFLEQHEG